MTANYNIVPWYNSDEWLRVYNDIYSDFPNKQSGLNVLLVWKARCPSLPAGIESTLCLLEVHLLDANSSINVNNDQILRLAYSSALMRYVNHMLDTETVKGVSLYQAAKNLGVPDWIIDLRHDTAHSNNLPSLELLRSACDISLQWLRRYYWDKHKLCIKDFSCGDKEVITSDDTKIMSLINFLTVLSICKHSKIKKLSDIPDSDMQESIVNDALEFLGDYTDLSNLRTVSVTNLINLMTVHGKKYLTAKNTAESVNKALLDNDSLFLSLDLVNYMDKYKFQNKHRLGTSYFKCFEVLLTFLHSNDLLFDFVLALIELTKTSMCPKKALLAALWVSEILKALKKSTKFLDRAERMHSNSSDIKKNAVMMYHHWFPNEKMNELILDLCKPVPSKLANMNIIQPIVSSYNPYLTYFVHNLLSLVEPKLPKTIMEKICRLANLISAPEKFPVKLLPEKIYTVDDIDLLEVTKDIDMDDVGKTIEDGGIWKIASRSHNWATCPIGQLPLRTALANKR